VRFYHEELSHLHATVVENGGNLSNFKHFVVSFRNVLNFKMQNESLFCKDLGAFLRIFCSNPFTLMYLIIS
jgi:hypothetical protein